MSVPNEDVKAEGQPRVQEWAAAIQVQAIDKTWNVWLAIYTGDSTVPRLKHILAGPFEAHDAAVNWMQDNPAPIRTSLPPTSPPGGSDQ